MRKKKLQLNRESIRVLSTTHLGQVAGGMTYTCDCDGIVKTANKAACGDTAQNCVCDSVNACVI